MLHIGNNGRRGSAGRLVICGLIGLLILAFDLMLPIGVAAALPYVALVFAGLWFADRRVGLVLAFMASGLTVAGHFLGDGSGASSVDLANRGLALFAIWVSAALVFRGRPRAPAWRPEEPATTTVHRTEAADLAAAQEALRQSETSLAEARRISHIGSWHRRDVFSELTWSDEVNRVLGLAPDTPLSRQALEDLLHPEDRERVLAAQDRLYAEGHPYDLEFRLVRPDGSVRHVHAISEAARGRDDRPVDLRGTIRDITDRADAEAALRAGEERLLLVTETSPGAIFMTRLVDNVIVYGNPAAGRLLGMAPENLVGRRAEGFYLDPEERRSLLDDVRAHGQVHNRELRLRVADGRLIWGLASAQLMDYHDEPVLLVTVVDISEVRDARAQVIQTSKLATLGQIASGIAHELNQPLGIARMAAESALMGMDQGRFDAVRIRRKLETITDQADRMAEIIDHMRLFSRKDMAGTQAFDPTASVAGVVRLVDRQFEASGICLERTIPQSCSSVRGHPVQLEQVVLNLLSNACDAVLQRAEESGASGYVPVIRIGLSDSGPDGTVVISASDNGGGIADENLGRIFDPFFTTKSEGRGTGLGLSVSYNIIDTMGGRIDVRNSGDGARFDIVLVACAEPAETATSGLASSGDAEDYAQAPESRRCALVVDDEPLSVESLTEFLQIESQFVNFATDYGVAYVTVSKGLRGLSWQ